MIRKVIYIFKGLLKKLSTTGFLHIFGTNVINKVVAFLSGIIIVRLVSKAAFGSYSYTLNAVSIAELFSGFGLVFGVFQLSSEKNDDKQAQERIYRFGSSYGLRINFAISLILFFLSFVVSFPVEGVNRLLRFCWLIPFFYIIPEFQFVYLRSRLKAKEYAYSNSICCACIAIFSILGAIVHDSEGALVGRTIAYVIAGITIRILFNARVYCRTMPLQENENKELISISAVNMVNTGLSQLLYIADVFLVGLVLTNQEMVAAYKVATTIPTALAFIPSSIIVYIYPYFAMHKNDYRWLKRRYRQIVFLMSLFNIIISGFLFLFAPSVISMVFGNNYMDAVAPFRVLLVNYFFSASFKILLGNILVMMRKLAFNLFETIMSSIINCIGDYFLISHFGIIGAAYTTVIVTTVASIISFVYFITILSRMKKTEISCVS